MGERGPARQPAEVAKAKGTYQPSRHGDGSFAPEIKVPAPAEWWDRKCPAMTEWKRVTAILLPFGLVTEADRAMLISYCDAWQQYVEAQVMVNDEGMVLTASTGYHYKNPALTILQESRAQIASISKKFGFTPSDRTGIKATSTPKPQSAVDAWQTLKGGKGS